MASITPRNYLNNKDILAEIHKSKTTFCYFAKPEYADFDIILSSISDIPSNLQLAKEQRAKRLFGKAQDAAKLLGSKLKAADAKIDVNDILDTDLIFRITSWDHIPEKEIDDTPKRAATSKKTKKQISIDDDADILDLTDDEAITVSPESGKLYVKLNFPPFLHYKLNDLGNLEVVGKSHWKGDLKTGSFNRDHGKATNNLALMWMKLVQRYGTRGNWRGYSYNDEMQLQALLQLCNVGLQFDESKSDNPFAYYTALVTNSFTRVWNIEKKNKDIRDDLLEIAGLDPSFSRQIQVSDQSDE